MTTTDRSTSNKGIHVCHHEGCDEAMQATAPTWLNIEEAGVSIYDVDDSTPWVITCPEGHEAPDWQRDAIVKHVTDAFARARRGREQGDIPVE